MNIVNKVLSIVLSLSYELGVDFIPGIILIIGALI